VTRVLLVDDDPLVRSALRLMLGGQADLEVVGEAVDGLDGLRLAGQTRPDVVLMDIRMPRLNGLEATRRLVAGPQPPRIIVLTTFDADEYVVRALAAGANGFLLKDTAPADIVDAISRVVAGEPMLSPAITEQLIRQVTDAMPDARADEARSRVGCLTDREQEVAIAIGRGSSNAEIATTLHMSIATVKAHISHIFTKLDVTNRVQVAIAMHEADLL